VRVTHPLNEVGVSVRVSKLMPGGFDVTVDVIEGITISDVMDEDSRPLIVDSVV
jgi:hypothetical protein